MTDYKKLCAELLAALEEEASNWNLEPEDHPLVERARAALAQPEPEGPTDDELRELWQDSWDTSEEHGAFQFARAVLARWSNHPESPDSSTQPIPVSERLPGDALSWWYEPDEDDDPTGYGGNWTLLRIRGNVSFYTHWLPAHALPVPSDA